MRGKDRVLAASGPLRLPTPLKLREKFVRALPWAWRGQRFERRRRPNLVAPFSSPTRRFVKVDRPTNEQQQAERRRSKRQYPRSAARRERQRRAADHDAVHPRRDPALVHEISNHPPTPVRVLTIRSAHAFEDSSGG